MYVCSHTAYDMPSEYCLQPCSLHKCNARCRLDVETRQEDVVGVRAAKLKEAKASCGHAQGSPEAVYGVAKAEQNAEGRCTGALAVEVEVPPHRVVPSIVLTTPDDDNYEPFPSRANSPVSTTSAASTASSGGSPVHTRLPMHSPPASSQSRSSWSLDPSSKLPVNSTNTLQLLSSLSPSSIGSIPEEPLLEEDIAEQCLYDYKSGDGSVDCITQFTPSKAGEEGVMQSLVTVPKESGGDNINLLSINKPASRKPVHAQRPRAMSLPNAQRESFHRGNLLGEDKSKELQEQTPNSVVGCGVVSLRGNVRRTVIG